MKGMRGKRSGALVVACAVLGLTGSVSAQSAKPPRPQVAVMDFDYGTLDNWWGQYDIGKGMADQVVDALVNDGTFRVIERKKLDTVLAEQDFAHSNRAEPSAATLAKIGKVKGVKYIIAGSITRFSTEKRGGGVRVKGIGIGAGKGKAQVNLTARVIDVTSGEIMASVKGEGVSNKGGDFSFSTHGVGVGTNAEEWRNSGIGEAQEKACNDFVAKLVTQKDRFE
jgi:curli biogenesis system outer membrane secretion channel CsgG